MVERKNWIWTYNLQGEKKSKESVKDLCNLRVEMRPAIFSDDGTTKFLAMADVKYNKNKNVLLAICDDVGEGNQFLNETFKTR